MEESLAGLVGDCIYYLKQCTIYNLGAVYFQIFPSNAFRLKLKSQEVKKFRQGRATVFVFTFLFQVKSYVLLGILFLTSNIMVISLSFICRCNQYGFYIFPMAWQDDEKNQAKMKVLGLPTELSAMFSSALFVQLPSTLSLSFPHPLSCTLLYLLTLGSSVISIFYTCFYDLTDSEQFYILGHLPIYLVLLSPFYFCTQPPPLPASAFPWITLVENLVCVIYSFRVFHYVLHKYVTTLQTVHGNGIKR